MRNFLLVFLIMSLPIVVFAQRTQEETLMGNNPRIIEQSDVPQVDQSKNEFPVNNRGGVSKFMRITDTERGINDLIGRVNVLETQMRQMKAEIEALKSKQAQTSNQTPSETP